MITVETIRALSDFDGDVETAEARAIAETLAIVGQGLTVQHLQATNGKFVKVSVCITSSTIELQVRALALAVVEDITIQRSVQECAQQLIEAVKLFQAAVEQGARDGS